MESTLFLILVLAIVGVHGQNRSPYFTNDMNNLNIREDTPAGSVVYILDGQDPDPGQSVSYGILSPYFDVQTVYNNTVGRTVGLVRLISKLNYDSLQEKTITATVWISDGVTREDRTVRIYVTDVNDEAPYFRRENYTTVIPETLQPGSAVFGYENTPPGTSVFTMIDAYDVDTFGNVLTVTCLDIPDNLTYQACEYFRVETTERNAQQWRGNIILQRQLDYEERQAFIIPLQVSDGTNIDRRNFSVLITDVQDAPPVFLPPFSSTVDENTPQGTSLMTVTARDGDLNNQRRIRYSLERNPGNFFTIDPQSGRISNTQPLTRDAQIFQTGSATLTVRASEELAEGQVGSDPTTSSTSDIVISLRNSANSAPRIDPSFVTTAIEENVAPGTVLPNAEFIIIDRDQGVNAEFEVFLADYSNVFEVSPTTGRGSLRVNVRVKDPSTIDYDRGKRDYDLRLVARETQSRERLSSEAYIKVNIKDSNDNAPQFDQPSYTASVPETAPGGTPVITITATDIDSGPYGQRGVRYKLEGDGANLFQVDSVTGQITVKPCPTPGSGQCLDYEQRRQYDLTFLARDSFGEGLLTPVPLTIRITNENDNAPRFLVRNYTSYINEGETVPDPRVIVQATDSDNVPTVTFPLSYVIVAGNNDGIWQINSNSGEITATRPVAYDATPQRRGYFQLTVRCSDNRFSDTSEVFIYVRDNNDHPPRFVPSEYYEQSISETTPPGTQVERVTALDDDPSTSPNGQVYYRIQSGDQGKFVIEEPTGVITVAPGATFDYDVTNQYRMIVIAADRGKPTPLSATATVVVNIRDTNNKKPYFEPSTVRIDVYENTPIGNSVYTMTATDPDADARLIYSFINPISGFDQYGSPVPNNVPYRDMFRIETDNGNVRVQNQLNRDTVARISYTVNVRDTSGGPDQTATATLVINILDINDRPPVFDPPWSISNPFINISMQEEQPPGFYVTTIVATDPDNTGISRYEIISNPGNYFTIDSTTGVVTTQRPVDYETVQVVNFVVIAVDGGKPQLTSTATVRVQVVNVNDENPIFTQNAYNVTVSEGALPDTSVTQVRATDRDLGDYGVVRYQLDDPLQRLQINPQTGVITVKDPQYLDREIADSFSLLVRASDSPNDASVRRYASVPLNVIVLDANDNPPQFPSNIYYATLVEMDPISTSVITVTATDPDQGENARIRYYITRGNPRGLFGIDPVTGQITVQQPLIGQAGRYNLTVEARDNGSPTLAGTSTVIITVQAANNGPPIWIIPSRDNQSFPIPEGKPAGQPVVTVIANDTDQGDSGVVTYYFWYNGVNTTSTPYFTINDVTGEITTNQEFDREARDEYVVTLVARDRGKDPKESNRTIIIKITDIDDNNPEFPSYQNCCTVPYRFNVTENQDPEIKLGQVLATDKDIGPNAEINYYIVGGDPRKYFRIDNVTGVIYTTAKLDREEKEIYELTIRALGRNNPVAQARPGCSPQCTDPSFVTVYITVNDRDDQAPQFSLTTYQACVSIDAPFGKSVTTVYATDKDSQQITYSLTQIQAFGLNNQPPKYGATNSTFIINSSNGTIHTNDLMQKFDQTYFTLGVLARDNGNNQGTTAAQIWVTDPAKEITLTARRNIEQVKQEQSSIIEYIKMQLQNPNAIVCINDIRYHINERRNIITSMTDVLIHIVDPDASKFYEPRDAVGLVWPPGGGSAGQLADSIAISAVKKTRSEYDGFYWQWLAVIVAVLFFLLLIALLLCCCLPWCLAWCCGKGKKKRQALYLNSLMAPSGMVNPLWKPHEYEDQELNMEVANMPEDIQMTGNYNMAFQGDVVDGKAGAGLSQTTTKEYAMNYEHTRTMMNGGNTLAIEGGHAPRIEAPLEPRADNGSTLRISPSTNTAATQYDAMGRSVAPALIMDSHGNLQRPTSPSGIGATLHTSHTDLSQFSYSIKSDQHSPPAYDPWNRGYGSIPAVHHHEIETEWEEDYPPHYQGEIVVGTYSSPPQLTPVPPQTVTESKHFEEYHHSRY